jgi:thiamine biosynthesis lipoprotein
MNRREFLRSRRLAKAVVDLQEAVAVLPSLVDDVPAQVPDVALLRFSRQAMATDFEVLIPFGTRDAVAAAEQALDEIDRLEAQLTVFRDDSEVSLLNHRAAAESVPVEAGLFELLQLAQQIHGETDGAYDITTGALTRTWGFHRRSGRVPGDSEVRRALDRTGMKQVALDPVRQTVRYLRSALEINLGSIGKGYALDRAAALLRRDGNITSALLHGGKSSILAVGSKPGSDRGWPVAIRHPWQPEQQLAAVYLRDRALGTSAVTFQHLEHQGKKLGHIIDPRTGWPAHGLASASAIAPTAAEADALATAFFIMTVEQSMRYCENHPQIGAVLLPDDQDAVPVTIGLAEKEINVCAGFAAHKPQQ